MPQGHVTQFFSAAYDDALSEREASRFAAHLKECASCASEYERFRISVDAIRELPKARMPQKVHLPTTEPIAERDRLLGWLRGARRPQLWYGGATAIAVAAAAVVFALSGIHAGTPTRSTAPGLSQALAPVRGTAAGTACTPKVTGYGPDQPPAGFFQDSRTDPRRPGQTLSIATSTALAAPGSRVIVYARLAVPAAAAAAPGAAPAAGSEAAVAPCVSVINGASASAPLSQREPNGQYNDQTNVLTSPLSEGSAASGSVKSYDRATPLTEFIVPAGAKPGSVIRVVATVAAGYPYPGDPAITVELQITVA